MNRHNILSSITTTVLISTKGTPILVANKKPRTAGLSSYWIQNSGNRYFESALNSLHNRSLSLAFKVSL